MSRTGIRTAVAGAIVWHLVGAGVHSQRFEPALGTQLDAYRVGRFRPDVDFSGWAFDEESKRLPRNIAGSTRFDPQAAAFLLEYAAAAYRAGEDSAYETFQDALKVAQRGSKGTPFDRAWHEAALALTLARGAGIDLGSVAAANRSAGAADLHVYPGDTRSPDATLDILAPHLTKTQVALARGVLREQVARYRGALMIRTLEHAVGMVSESRSGRPLPGGMDVSPARTRQMNISFERRLLDEAIRDFVSAEQDPDLRPEALLRHAATLSFMSEHHTVFQEGEHTEAGAMFDDVSRLTDDPDLRFLAVLFAGRFCQSRGDLTGAAQYYVNAASIYPDAWSARLSLTNLRYLTGGQPEDVLSPIEHQTLTRDPWPLYPYGSYARWPDLIARLRAQADRYDQSGVGREMLDGK